MHQTQVSNYETGRSAIPESRAEAIAAALNMDVSYVRQRLGMWVPDPDNHAMGDGLRAMEIERAGIMHATVHPAKIQARAAPAVGIPTGAALDTTTPAAFGEAYRVAAVLGARAGADIERLFDSVDFNRRLAELDPHAPDLAEQVARVLDEVLTARPYLFSDASSG